MIAIGLECCGDVMELAVDPREKAIIQKEVHRLNVLRADKEVNPESCVKVK